ncbi:MAG: hypothetical protein D6713_05295 [Deltaproteobacteria bacterium]|nr:MAG: hypothetical protein D6713_05295 [Deltaproteobacteria bacterium]
MSHDFSFSRISIGDPVRVREVTFFPLSGVPQAPISYTFIDDALERGDAVVEEVSEAGTVPELRLINFSESILFVLDGTELKGAKQNRVVNASLLIPPKSSTRIPVSCVEEGRWRFTTRRFQKSDFYSPPKIRKRIALSQRESMRSRRRYDADQLGVWEDVREVAQKAKARTATGALHDVFEGTQPTLREYEKSFSLRGTEQGGAFFVGDGFTGFDLFDRHGTYARAFPKFLRSVALEAVTSGLRATRPPEALRSELEAVFREIEEALFEKYHIIGIGEDYRYEGKLSFGKGLYYEGHLIHFSAFSR